MTVRIHSEAEAELQAAAQWYENQLAELGARFLGEAVDAFLAIEKHPERFPRTTYRTSRNIRRRLLDHFPYVVVFEILPSECLILAVAHTKRRPAYWRKRTL